MKAEVAEECNPAKDTPGLPNNDQSNLHDNSTDCFDPQQSNDLFYIYEEEQQNYDHMRKEIVRTRQLHRKVQQNSQFTTSTNKHPDSIRNN